MTGMEVQAQGFWTPGFATLPAWLEGRPDPAVLKPVAGIIPPMTRRRTSLLTRILAEVLGQVLDGADVDGASVPTIFASAHGETSTLGFLLDQMQGPEPGLSPIRFSGSVHNAASGYSSIALGNRSFTTSIAAGEATVAAALLEAQAYLATRSGTVAIIIGDTRPLEGLVPPEQRFETFAVALLLTGSGQGNEPIARLEHLRQGPVLAREDSALPPAYAAHPCRPALELLAAINGKGGTVSVEAPREGNWSVDVLPVGLS